MSAILCLAHFCDTHGPTPLMTCEGLPAPCSICFENDGSRTDRRSSVSHSMRSDGTNRPSKAFAKAIPATADHEVLLLAPSTHIPSSFDAPLDGSRTSAQNIARQIPGRDSSFRKTYDENDQKRDRPCENCALTIPTKVKDQIPDGAPGSPLKSGQPFSTSPVIRSRVAFETVSTIESCSPQSDLTIPETPGYNPVISQCPAPSGVMSRTATTSTTSSVHSSSSSNSSATSHNHYLNYTSSHDPVSTANYSALRRSCLRTLSCETLPPTSTSSSVSPTSPTSLFPPSFSSASTNSSFRVSNPQIGGGGPIFFGDPQAGFTTAFIFRVRDPYARGQRRIYAFICLSQQKEAKAMKAFGLLSKAFKELAAWIQALAELENDKIDNTAIGSGFDGIRRGSENSSVTSSFGGSSGSMLSSGGFGGGIGGGGYSRRGGSTTTSAMHMNSPRNRGLADLVGRPDFFLDLHAKFVGLAAQLTSLGL